MPSQSQHSASQSDYRNEFHRVFALDSFNPAPMIRGVACRERALLAHQEAHKCNASKDEKEYIAALLKKYE